MPHVFEANSPAKADEVNTNFDALTTGVNDNNTRITTNEGTIGANQTDIANNKSNISTNATNISNNQQSISNNSSQITTLNDSLGQLQSTGGVVKGKLNKQLTGTVTISAGSTQVNGFDTLFTQEVRVGDAVVIQGGDTSAAAVTFTVVSIAHDLELMVSEAHSAGVLNAAAFTDDNLMEIMTGSDETKVTVNKSGDVGIGTTTPQNPLHVKGSAGAGQNLEDGVHAGIDKSTNPHIEIVGDQKFPYIDFSNDNVTDFDARVILTDDDSLYVEGANVGINVTQPEAKLDVGGNVLVRGKINFVGGQGPMCIFSKQCPTGWTDKGEGGFLINTSTGSCPFNPGGNYGGPWNWCHPRICCN